jgi:platelet-activating factor acetylhydrolase IB subunit beta/gamma
MLWSPLRRLFARARSRRPYEKPSPQHRSPRRSAPPRLEPLEDRCLLSGDPTMPSLDGAPLIVVLYEQLMLSLPKTKPSVVFLGDSYSFNFAYIAGAPIWSALAGPLDAVDYGVSGQTTQNLLYQLAQGQLNKEHPWVIVLDIGGNNLLEGETPQQTAAGIVACVNAIHQSQPQAKVLLLAVPPGGPGPDDPYRIASNQTDALAEQMLAGDPQTSFINLAPVFEQADGTISPSLLFDYVHPTTLGYLDLTFALLPPLVGAWESAALASSNGNS